MKSISQLLQPHIREEREREMQRKEEIEEDGEDTVDVVFVFVNKGL